MKPRDIALQKAKIQLMSRRDSAFFTTVLFSLPIKWDDTIPTACTNGKFIWISTKFFLELSPEERVFLLLHEAMHVAYLHMIRLMGRIAAKWNVAADHVINLMLIARGFKMPKGGLADNQYIGMSTEEVYALLPEQDPQKVDMDLKPSEEKDESLDREITDILMRAAIQSKMQQDAIGTIPSDIAIYLEKLLNPKLPWHRILRKYLTSQCKVDYSYRKLNRRFFPQYMLPSVVGEKVTDLAIGLDTSGSVSDEDFQVFVSEVNGIFRMMKPNKITLVQFDTQIKEVSELRSILELRKVVFTGRGGTDIVPLINWVNVNKPKLTLIFSDGHFRFKSADTKSPVIWVVHNHPKFDAPFGKVIHYSI